MAQNSPMSDNADPLRGSNSLHPQQKDLAAAEPGSPGNTGLDRSKASHEFANERGDKGMAQQQQGTHGNKGGMQGGGMGTTGGTTSGNVQEQKSSPAGKPNPDKGLGYFPISDMQFDVVTLVYEKSKAMQAYDSYIRDAQANPELLKVMEEIRADDRKHIESLKGFLGNC